MHLFLHISFLSWLIQTDWIPYDFHKYHEYFTQYISIYLLSALFPHISVLSYHLWPLSQTDGIPEAGLTQDYFRGRIVRAGASQGLPCTVSGHTSNTDTNKDIQTQIYQCEYTNTRDKHTKKIHKYTCKHTDAGLFLKRCGGSLVLCQCLISSCLWMKVYKQVDITVSHVEESHLCINSIIHQRYASHVDADNS